VEGVVWSMIEHNCYKSLLLTYSGRNNDGATVQKNLLKEIITSYVTGHVWMHCFIFGLDYIDSCHSMIKLVSFYFIAHGGSRAKSANSKE